MFEAVGGGFVSVLAVLLPALTEQQCSLVQEQVPLHGLKARQILHSRRTLFVTDPHTEGALHQDPAQIAQITLTHKQHE